MRCIVTTHDHCLLLINIYLYITSSIGYKDECRIFCQLIGLLLMLVLRVGSTFRGGVSKDDGMGILIENFYFIYFVSKRFQKGKLKYAATSTEPNETTTTTKF